MITIFTNPRPFHEPFDLIQRNAIRSWTLLRPTCEILLFEDEKGTTQRVARELNTGYVGDALHNEYGTPLLNSVFSRARQEARFDIVAYVNADIILFDDFVKAVGRVKDRMGEKPFFMAGRRWDMDISGSLAFEDPAWREKLQERMRKEGALHGYAGMDYWVFPRSLDFHPPEFVVGRPGMDSWLVWKARSSKIPVIDATEVITIAHQNHEPSSKRAPHFFIEKQRNLKLAGGYLNMMTLRDADWLFTSTGLKRPQFPRRVFSLISLWYPWRALLVMKRILARYVSMWPILSLAILALAIGLTPRIPVGTLEGLGRVIDIRGEDLWMIVLALVWAVAFFKSRQQNIRSTPLFLPILIWTGIGFTSLL